MAGQRDFLPAGAANAGNGANEFLSKNKRAGAMRTQKYTFGDWHSKARSRKMGERAKQGINTEKKWHNLQF